MRKGSFGRRSKRPEREKPNGKYEKSVEESDTSVMRRWVDGCFKVIFTERRTFKFRSHRKTARYYRYRRKTVVTAAAKKQTQSIKANGPLSQAALPHMALHIPTRVATCRNLAPALCTPSPCADQALRLTSNAPVLHSIVRAPAPCTAYMCATPRSEAARPARVMTDAPPPSDAPPRALACADTFAPL